MTITIKLPRDAEPSGIFEFHTDRFEVRSPDGVFTIQQTDEGLSLKAPDGNVTIIKAGKPPRKMTTAKPSTHPMVVARPKPRKTTCPNCRVTIEYMPEHVRPVPGPSLGDDGPSVAVKCPECGHYANPSSEFRGG